MDKILVTGSAGFLGSTFALEALRKGYSVIGVDNYINSSSNSTSMLSSESKNFSFEKVDLRNFNDLNELLSRTQPEYIVHFAGSKSLSDSFLDPVFYWENNVSSSINLLKSMKENGIKNIIFSSSATVYGENELQPVCEDFDLSPQSPYANTKFVVEKLIEDSSDHINYMILRYFNPIGAHKEGLFFDYPSKTANNIMPRLIRVARGIEDHIKVFGDDYETSDGTGERDYIHVSDLIESHILSLEHLKNTRPSHILNIGTGKKYSVLDLIKTFSKVVGIKINYKIVGRREGDIPVSYADSSKSFDVLNFKPKKDLAEMCIDSWKAVKNIDISE